MSLEIPQETIEQVYGVLDDERVQDLILVVSRTDDAVREGRPVDGTFAEGLAEVRLNQATDLYSYPVLGTYPTVESSLRIVSGIMAIRELNEARSKRTGPIERGGTEDLALAEATGRERCHRLYEKGILRILDPHTSRTMWSAEHNILVMNRPGQERIQNLVDTLVENNRQDR